MKRSKNCTELQEDLDWAISYIKQLEGESKKLRDTPHTLTEREVSNILAGVVDLASHYEELKKVHGGGSCQKSEDLL